MKKILMNEMPTCEKECPFSKWDNWDKMFYCGLADAKEENWDCEVCEYLEEKT